MAGLEGGGVSGFLSVVDKDESSSSFPPSSMPLQELPCLSSQCSTLSQSKRGHKRKPKDGVIEGLDSECTPVELIQQWSPLCKHPRPIFKGKENEGSQFVLGRRSRKKIACTSGLSWDQLPDELLLRIFFCFPLQDLLRMSRVCKRWHRLAFDESLWHSVDLAGSTHGGVVLQQVLKTRVRRLRCPRVLVEESHFPGTSPLQIIQMDLSNSVIPTSALESIISRCRLLEHLSLEGLQLSDGVMGSLAMNPNIQQLNLCGCSGFSAPALADMLGRCCSIEQLNISWCEFNRDHVGSLVNNLTTCVTHLNLSGYRDNLTLADVKVVVERCPRIQTLDLSDSTLLMADSFPVLAQLQCLQHLSLSRCYHIHLAALTDVAKMLPSLRLLDVFGLVNDTHLNSLKKEMPRLCINSRPFSCTSRPTPSAGGDQAMWNASCRLRLSC